MPRIFVILDLLKSGFLPVVTENASSNKAPTSKAKAHLPTTLKEMILRQQRNQKTVDLSIQSLCNTNERDQNSTETASARRVAIPYGCNLMRHKISQVAFSLAKKGLYVSV